MSDRLPSGPPRPEVYAADGSIVNNRLLTLKNVDGSVNFREEVNRGSNASGNVSQQASQADSVATGGSCVNRDNIVVKSAKGDVNFSVTVTSGQEQAGAAGGTLPSSTG